MVLLPHATTQTKDNLELHPWEQTLLKNKTALNTEKPSATLDQ